jgi:hypothetical protein
MRQEGWVSPKGKTQPFIPLRRVSVPVLLWHGTALSRIHHARLRQVAVGEHGDNGRSMRPPGRQDTPGHPGMPQEAPEAIDEKLRRGRLPS